MIPDSIRRILPKEGQKFFADAYTNARQRHSEINATKVAWALTKKRFKPDGAVFVANNDDFKAPQLYTFEMTPSNEVLITNSDDGEIMVDAVLADTSPRKGDGKRFTAEALQEIAEQINTDGSTIPDVEHLITNNLLSKPGNIDEIISEVKRQKGLFKKIKAAVREGKLWIRAWLDKRYEKIIKQHKFLSIEALATARDNGELIKPKYIGFTFTKSPRIAGASIAE